MILKMTARNFGSSFRVIMRNDMPKTNQNRTRAFSHGMMRQKLPTLIKKYRLNLEILVLVLG
jgi:hypothetical protein